MQGGKYTIEEFRLIEMHDYTIINAAESALVNLRSIPAANRPDQVNGQIAYWKHVISAMKFSIAQARSKIVGGQNAERSTIQQPGADT